jgi:hypothetical protein
MSELQTPISRKSEHSGPSYDLHTYHWPFDGNLAKFSTKDNLTSDYQHVWDGRNLDDLYDIDSQKPLGVTDIIDGSKVFIEHGVVGYAGKKASEKSDAYSAVCSLKLLPIGVLEDSPTGGPSPFKKRRMVSRG